MLRLQQQLILCFNLRISRYFSSQLLSLPSDGEDFKFGTRGQQWCHVSHSHIQEKKKKNFEKVEVEPEWKFARCIVGETSWENSAANFLSNTKSIQCFSPSVLDSAEQNHECLLVPSLIFADFNVIFIRAGAAPCRPRRAASPVGGVKSHFLFGLLLYSEWKCLLIRQTVQRTSNHHISIGLRYRPNWIFVWWVSRSKEGESLNSVRLSERQEPDGISVSVRAKWLMASPNYSLSLWIFCLLSDCWLLKVCVCPSFSLTWWK